MKTRLQSFMVKNGLRPVAFAKESGVPRQTLTKIANGRMETKRPHMVKLLAAARRLLNRRVMIDEMFNFDSAARS